MNPAIVLPTHRLAHPSSCPFIVVLTAMRVLNPLGADLGNLKYLTFATDFFRCRALLNLQELPGGVDQAALQISLVPSAILLHGAGFTEKINPPEPEVIRAVVEAHADRDFSVLSYFKTSNRIARLIVLEPGKE